MAATKEETWPKVAVRVVVYLAGMGVGGFFGWLGGALWRGASDSWGIKATLIWTGIILGGLGGLLAGHWWCKRMTAHRARPSAWLTLRGGGNGVIAGLAVTAFLHAGLAVTRGILGWPSGGMYVFAFSPFVLGFALGAGFATGCLCGLLVWIVALVSARKAPL